MSTQPMQFPRPGRLLLWAFLFVFAAPIVVGVPVAAWMYWKLDPVQSFYFGTYLESAMEGTTRGATVTVRYASKTAPRRPPAPLLPGDAERGMSASQPLVLSSKAITEGWRGITVAPLRKVRPPELETYLRTTIYDDESAWQILGEPVLALLALLFLPYLAVRLWRSDSKRSRAHEERHGRRTKGPELVSGLARFGRSGGDGIRLRLQGRGILPGGSFRIPKRLESSHILLMGDTGSGKSPAIRQILRQVQERGESAIVYDPAMDFIGEFYNPERGDLILNPLDARCPYWNLPGELSSFEVATTIAAAMLPDKEYEKSFFTDAPRRVLARLLLEKPSVHRLIQWMSDPEEITRRVKGTAQAAMVDPGAPAQRAGVLSSLNLISDSLELLPERENRDIFSTDDWQFKRTRWVFLTSSRRVPRETAAAAFGVARPVHPAHDAAVRERGSEAGLVRSR